MLCHEELLTFGKLTEYQLFVFIVEIIQANMLLYLFRLALGPVITSLLGYVILGSTRPLELANRGVYCFAVDIEVLDFTLV